MRQLSFSALCLLYCTVSSVHAGLWIFRRSSSTVSQASYDWSSGRILWGFHPTQRTQRTQNNGRNTAAIADVTNATTASMFAFWKGTLPPRKIEGLGFANEK